MGRKVAEVDARNSSSGNGRRRGKGGRLLRPKR